MEWYERKGKQMIGKDGERERERVRAGVLYTSLVPRYTLMCPSEWWLSGGTVGWLGCLLAGESLFSLSLSLGQSLAPPNLCGLAHTRSLDSSMVVLSTFLWLFG